MCHRAAATGTIAIWRPTASLDDCTSPIALGGRESLDREPSSVVWGYLSGLRSTIGCGRLAVMQAQFRPLANQICVVKLAINLAGVHMTSSCTCRMQATITTTETTDWPSFARYLPRETYRGNLAAMKAASQQTILCLLSRDYNCDSTAIRLRSDYDISHASTSIRCDSTRAKNEHVNFSSYRSRIAIVI